MGYRRGALLLEWPEESEFAGLEVRMKRMSIRQLLRVEKLGDLRRSGTPEETETAMTEILDTIGKGLLGWNYEEERTDEAGNSIVVPVPAVRESLDDIDMDLMLTLVRAWTKAAAAVPLASPPSSPTGAPEPPQEEWALFLATSQENSPAPASS